MLQRPHFLPKDSPSSVAQTAHCVRIISTYKRAVGSLAYELLPGPATELASAHKDTSKFEACALAAFACLCEACRGCQTARKFKRGAAEHTSLSSVLCGTATRAPAAASPLPKRALAGGRTASRRRPFGR